MSEDIRNIRNMNHLIRYFANVLNWDIDTDSFDPEELSYDFSASDLGLKDDAFAKIRSLKQLPPLVEDQPWGIFSVEFDSKKFEVTALRKVLSGLIPKQRNAANHAVWDKDNLLFLCFWGEDNDRTIGIAHFEDKDYGLPQIKMIYCSPSNEDTIHIQDFVVKLGNLTWPIEVHNTQKWHDDWSKAFTKTYKQTIRDSETLTNQLAREALNIRDRILDTMCIESETGYVHQLFEKFKNTLVHDMTEKQFADMYAQTVVYGLFSARCMDKTQDDFSADEAVSCIPNTNPFLKNLMRECFGAEKNSKLSFDELEIGNVVELLRHTKTDDIITDFNRQTGRGKEDTVIHFYENFLEAYDKTQKVDRGVFYTPQPVVNFIVKAVDTLLKNDFGYTDGLASTDTKTIKGFRHSRKAGDYDRMVEDNIVVPAVQILDPATGTGTFLRQTIIQIYDNFKAINQGCSKEELHQRWNRYVTKHLLPRINAFELMMAPYAVAHMKLALILKDTGYDFENDARLNVYLTNSLEKPGNSDKQIGMFDDPLASEAISANIVKKNNGISIIIGNPPYNISSNNKNDWIQNLLDDFKLGLDEKKLNLDDDYIKFIKYAQSLVSTAGEGIVAYITNNSYIDGVSHRRIRESLLETFEQIYIFDLHGNVMKQEKCADGSKDENVFDIKQGVSIGIFVKRKNAPRFVKYFSLMGSRSIKDNFLNTTSFAQIPWIDLKPQKPEFLFVPYANDARATYDCGFSVSDLFLMLNSGIQTKCDDISVQRTEAKLEDVLNMIRSSSLTTFKNHYPQKKEGRDWKFELAQKDVIKGHGVITAYYYRPFDVEYIWYSGKTKGLIAYPRREVMDNMVGKKNIALCMMKQFFQDTTYNHIFVSDLPIDERFLYSNRGGTYIFPLYQYYDIDNTVRYNFNTDIIRSIESDLDMKLGDVSDSDTFTGLELIQYIYAVLHSKKYRNTYNDQLKYAFPRIPYPKDAKYFRDMVSFGKALFDLHLPQKYYKTDSSVLLPELRSYEFRGDKVILNNEIQVDACENINKMQLGGYCPAAKWLKDRVGDEFTERDLEIYKEIIKSIIETNNIMDNIDGTIDL